jgi:hypothetical protein
MPVDKSFGLGVMVNTFVTSDSVVECAKALDYRSFQVKKKI